MNTQTQKCFFAIVSQVFCFPRQKISWEKNNRATFQRPTNKGKKCFFLTTRYENSSNIARRSYCSDRRYRNLGQTSAWQWTRNANNNFDKTLTNPFTKVEKSWSNFGFGWCGKEREIHVTLLKSPFNNFNKSM